MQTVHENGADKGACQEVSHGEHYHCSVCGVDFGTVSEFKVAAVWIRTTAGVIKWFCMACFKRVER